MRLEMFINFDGSCREAVEFYARVFKSKVTDLMTYSDAPPESNYTVQQADRNKIMYAGVPIGGMTVMFCDAPANSGYIKGNNICPTVSADNLDEVRRIFNELKEGGTICMELQKTFYSELFGMVEDRYGVIWQILHHTPAK